MTLVKPEEPQKHRTIVNPSGYYSRTGRARGEVLRSMPTPRPEKTSTPYRGVYPSKPHGKRITGYIGRFQIAGKRHYTKTMPTPEAARDERERMMRDFGLGLHPEWEVGRGEPKRDRIDGRSIEGPRKRRLGLDRFGNRIPTQTDR